MEFWKSMFFLILIAIVVAAFLYAVGDTIWRLIRDRIKNGYDTKRLQEEIKKLKQ